MRKPVLFFLLMLAGLGLSAQSVDLSLFSGIKPRSIGPAGMSGRVTAFDVVESEPDIIYAGTASGGLWKSESGGIAWAPVFDSVGVLSIGAIAVNQRNPDVVWVGTGEGNPRNSQTMGAGVYRSLDGGRSWQYMGLKETRTIHRIILHRDNPDVVYVSAQGDSWADSEHRGVYRTRDGGKSWEKILYVNPRTGASTMVVDPSNPNKILVNMWEYRRWPWFFKSGGPGSGLHLSLDGGSSWKKLGTENGLPAGELGKMGLAFAPSNPKVVYALVESKKNALYRSDDGGFSWRMVADKNIGDRPFYYFDIYVDPSNENRLYNIFSNVTVSNDGGKTFQTLLGWDNIHGDHHAWWIHPKDPDFMLDGNDGGIGITRDRGKTWRFVENLPVGQFYHIAVDQAFPYHVYGGMQDNGTWRGPNTAWRAGGVRNAYFDEIGFGDGFDVVPERDNQRFGYVMWQGGNLLRVDFQTGAQQWVKPVHPQGAHLRFNWNSGIAADPSDPSTIYYGSQFLHRSTDRGKSWELISPDLTTNDPEKLKQTTTGGLTLDGSGAENHCTILAIAPSSRERDVIWIGADDGNVQLTRDGGKTWTNVAANLPGLPKGSWIPQVHASPFRPGEAYVVANNYRRGDWAPYLYRTRDHGKTWERLADDKKVNGYCLSWVQDPLEPKLQFLGTEFGLYVSIDEGKTWNKWTSGYPDGLSTYDMVIHPREHDLVIATFGRALWVLDDIRPLRELARQGKALLDKPLHLFPAPDAYLAAFQQGAGTRFTGNSYFKGESRPYGALLTFSVKNILKKNDDGSAAKSDSLWVEVLNGKEERVRRFRAPVQAGVNRVVWDLSTDGSRSPLEPKPKNPDAPLPAGRPVLPGVYTVRLSYGDQQALSLVNVLPDPRMEVKIAEITAFYELWDAFNRQVDRATAAMDNLREAKGRLQTLAAMVGDQVPAGENKTQFMDNHKKLGAQIDSLMNLMASDPEKMQGFVTYPEQLSTKISAAAAFFNPAFDAPNPAFQAPTASHRLAVEQAGREIQAFVQQINQFFSKEWKGFEEKVDTLKLDLTRSIEPVKVE